MRFILCLLLVMFCTASVGLAQDDSVVWVTVKESQLMEWAATILEQKSKLHEYSANITVLQMEILRLQNNNLELKKLYNNARKGLWLGGGGGLNTNKDINIEAILLYEFNQSAVYLSGGYGGYPYIQAGYLHKINSRR